MIKTLKLELFTALLLGGCTISMCAFAQSASFFQPLPPGADLTPQQETILEALKNKPTAKSVQVQTLNTRLLELDNLPFNLDGQDYSLIKSSMKKLKGTKESYRWEGFDAPKEQITATESVIIVDDRGLVTGTVTSGDKILEIRPLGGDAHAIIEIDPTAFPQEHPDAPPKSSPTDEDNNGSVSPDASNASSTIDIYIAYTPSAAKSIVSIQGHAQLAVATANSVYKNTGLKTRLNLAGYSVETYAESSSMKTDLHRLKAKSDGFLDSIHTLREEHKADLVHLIVNRNDYCGYAYVNANSSSAFGVTDHSCVGSNKSFTHEVGHNLGGCHDPANASSCPFSFGYGYQDPEMKFRTVMAYNCATNCRRIAIHSYPQKYGVQGKNDVKKVIKSRTQTVAGFR
ncbi:M12 family metallo-peptidase [Cohaesibacter intestini]|uniref:M12 family metallo-peptidase n=1 Tax=Cohaesibacter intestini TaxID=2211145 RepID=UPI000DEA2592|nr:M12 family metallo-peptidase [Cohaesibacter intestini]